MLPEIYSLVLKFSIILKTYLVICLVSAWMETTWSSGRGVSLQQWDVGLHLSVKWWCMGSCSFLNYRKLLLKIFIIIGVHEFYKLTLCFFSFSLNGNSLVFRKKSGLAWSSGRGVSLQGWDVGLHLSVKWRWMISKGSCSFLNYWKTIPEKYSL